MNNNNRGNSNNNRRRGRNNSNRQQGGGNQMNRIDSRARGNAPQMLDKYKKMASDASLNGDRVQAEYYLQFADHYYRVIADQRVRQEEQRGKREDRDQDRTNDDSDDVDNESQNDNRHNPRGRGRDNGGSGPDRNPRHSTRDDRASSRDEDDDNDDDGENGSDDYEPAENPFTRTSRRPRPARDDADRQATEVAAKPARKPRAPRKMASPDGDGAAPALDASVLPPPIGSTGVGDEEPKKRTRRPRAKPDGEAIEQVG